MFKVRIHLKNPTKKNPAIVVAAMWCDSNAIGTFRRTFKHKGIDSGWILERDMTEEEQKREAASWRLHWYSYESWKGLIEDEWRVTQDAGWVQMLFIQSRLPGRISDYLKNK